MVHYFSRCCYARPLATEKIEKCKCFFQSQVHDLQHPTLHFNQYKLDSFAVLICIYSASSGPFPCLLLNANCPLAHRGRRAVYLYPPPSKTLPTLFTKVSHTSILQHLHSRLVADLESLDLELLPFVFTILPYRNRCRHLVRLPGANLRRNTTLSSQAAAIRAPVIVSLCMY